jgi:hypothetical protein
MQLDLLRFVATQGFVFDIVFTASLCPANASLDLWSSEPPPDSRQHIRPCSSASEAAITSLIYIRKLFADPVITVLICNYEPLSFVTCCTFSHYFTAKDYDDEFMILFWKCTTIYFIVFINF